MSSTVEERVREALGAAAESVPIDAEAYRLTQAEWRRRERRRRLLVVALAVAFIALADIVGLWALNHARSGSPVVFDGPAPARVSPQQPDAGQPGQLRLDGRTREAPAP
jgi:hypothetical protein